MSVLTFLFTDIEGSTRRWEADADAMRVALEEHNATLHDAVAAHGGTVFNYTGDGICAAFESPKGAVEAAVAAQHALELPVRMGIATGEAELRGGEYFGTVLNRTARVMAAGHGGQILIDGATAGLLAGVDLMTLGPRHLRDISNPVDVFQVRAEGLRIEFPPLKTADSAPGNLRPPPTSFIGRQAELADLESALKAHRMVTLTGVGGVGKTRLALEVAVRSAADFPDGVWVVELASVGDPSAVPEAVAAALGITQQAGMSLADSVAAALEGRSRLLVFDNCEHVLDAAADMIEAIFNHSQTVRILATSREGLRVADEHLWSVPSLDLRAGIDSSAAALFVERAEAVAHGPMLGGASDAEAIVEICRHLDGIPLGIELAASRMQSMTASEVRDRLGDRFRLLVGSRRGLERHQTLRHAVQWSYDLLDDAEKALLDRCSVFAGGFDLKGAQAVTVSDDEFATLDLLDALVRKSLLVADRSSGQTRYSMLETIRQFAEEQLVQGGAAESTRRAHARYFDGREADVLALWDGPTQRDAYEWFGIELANLRTAFRWAADHGDLDIAIGIATYAAFLGRCVHQHEAIVWTEELIEPARAVGHRRLARLYSTVAQCYLLGRVDDGLRYAEACLDAIDSGRYSEVPDRELTWLGGLYLAKNQPQRWVALCRKLYGPGRGDDSYVKACLALALSTGGADDEAIAVSQGLPAAAQVSDNPHVSSYLLLAYGIAYRHTDPLAAYDAHRRGLDIAQLSGNRELESYHAGNLARLAIFHGKVGDALENLRFAIQVWHDSGAYQIMSSAHAVLAALFDRIGNYEVAATLSGISEVPFAQATYPEFTATIAHLREVLGDSPYESLARIGTNMTNAARANYALEQIELAQAQLL